jgi:hypothetical protein
MITSLKLNLREDIHVTADSLFFDLGSTLAGKYCCHCGN